jgi:Ca2+-binding RTX toxin-like protein
MIVEIRIEGKPVPGPIPGDHLYFVGVDENGNEFVIRGGPSDDVPPFEFIETEKGIPIEESEDYRPIEDRDARGSEVLDFGTQDVNEVWDKMKDAADKVERYKMNYDTLGTNSATAGAIVLSSVGIDIKDVLPDQPGQNDTYPGTGVLDSSELPDRVFDIMDEIIDEGIDFAQGLFNDLLELSQEVLIEIEEQIQEITSGAERTLNNLINEIEDFFRDAAALRLDPLTLDLDGDGLELTSLADSTTNFDLDNNGSAERTGWVSGDDGLLALDRNSNGTIDNGSELFGDATPINGGTEIAADGFEALSDLDSNADGVIDSNDAQFSDLRVWQDLDQDGVSDAGELSSLSDLGIDSIDLNATFNDGSVNGNDVTHLSTFTKNDQTQGTIGNVLFQSGHVNSEYAGEYTLSLDALLLPTIRGYGNAPDLHIAMSLDASLLTMVQNFAGAEAVQPEVDFFKNTEEMIYKWTGVEGVDPDLFGNVMGVPIDARKVKALEVFLATEYTGQLFTATLDLLNNAWDNLVNSIGTRLMVLGPAESLFPEASYSLAADSLTTTSTMAALTQVALDNQPTGQTENIGYWYNMKRVLYGFGLDKGLTTSDVDTEINLLASADEQEIIYMDDGKSVLFVPEGAGVITTDNAADLVLGFGSDDVINTTSGNDTIFGGDGNDVIDGGTGVNTIDGGAGDDTLSSSTVSSSGNSYTGGAGNDTIIGNSYSDNYYFNLGDGQDTITDLNGAGFYDDKIYLGAGITTADVSLSRESLDLLISVGAGGDQIRVKEWYANGTNRIEELHFDDGTVWDVNTLHQNGAVLFGTAGGDILTGLNGLTETIYGLDGNDVIDGGTGADTIDGGAGDDTLSSDFISSGGSTYTGGTGNDTITGGQYHDDYHFNLGDGQDTITDLAGSSLYSDKIYLGVGITTADVSLSRESLDLLISVGAGGDQIRVKEWYANNTNRIEELHFDDGTVWDVNTLHQNGAVLFGTAGDDILTGVDNLNGTIYGLGGNDTINTTSGNDTIFGGDGNDVIDGGTGANTIDGGAGDDTLSSSTVSSSGNSYTGGAGNDTITGNQYSDNYYFNLGDGQDTITDLNGAGFYDDKIYLGAGITTADVSLSRESLDLLISVGAGGDQIRVKEWYANGTNRIEELHFDDGTVWDVNTLHQNGAVLFGTAGDDILTGLNGLTETIYGLDGNDVIDGGTGADTIDGGAGDDTLSSDFISSGGSTYTGGTGNDTITGGQYHDDYHFNLGDGQDTITDLAGSSLYSDKIYLGVGITTADVSLSRESLDLLISVGAGGDQIRVKEWYANNTNRIEELHFDDGTVWDVNTLHQNGAVLFGTAGDDILTGVDNLNGTIYGLGGNDTINTTSGNDTIFGGDGNDVIDGGTGANTIDGGAGDDTLSSSTVSSSGNSYTGGAGNDTITGNQYSDNYYFNLGDGQDTITDLNGAGFYDDKIYLGAGITTADVSLSRESLDLLISVGAGGDQIRVKEWYANGTNRIEELHFDDGTVWDVNTLHQNGAVLFGTAGDDILTGLNGLTETIYGLDGNDVIDGGTGADTIDGGAGDDTLSSDFISSGGSTYTGGTGNDTITGGQYNDSYHFNLGDGQDTITDLAGSSLYSDKIYLGAGITITDVSLSQENHDLLIDVGTGGDQIRIKDWYVNNANRVEELHFDDGTMWDVNFLHQNSAPIIGTASNDTLNGVAGENDMMYGLGGNDVIDGGTGANTLDGGAGDDTLSSDFNNSHGSTYTGGIGNDTITGGQYSDSYHFNLGDGQDTISEVGGQNSHLDKIYLGAGITIADVSVNRDTLDLVIDVGTGGDQIRIKDWYANNANRIEELHFDDGTMWDVNTLHQNNAPLIATEGDDILTGVSGANDIIYGLGGSDIINSSDGNDSVFGDDGNDLINGGTGVNTLDGGAGDDMLSSDFYGSDGSVYTGGTGNDTITGGYYHDSYHFNLGDGQDTISEVGGYSPYLDKIHLGVGVTTADVSLSRDNLDMLIDVGTGGDQIRIKDWYANNNNRIEELHFDDGTVWDVNTLHQNGAQLFGTEGDDTLSGMNGLTETIHGLGGNDVIDGGTGADTLDGGAGDDTLSSDFNNSNGSSYTGGTGNDTITGGLYTDSYYFNLGDGQDTISEVGGYNSIYYNDKIYLGAGIATTDVSLSRDNLDMLVDVGTGGDQIRIKDWYASNNNRIEELHFDDGTVWDVNTLHQNGAVLNGTEGDDTLSGINGLTETIQGLGGNDTISGGTGIKTIDGGAGDDTLSSDFTNSNGSTYTGGTGNDTITGGLYIDNYHFNLGDGQDTISEVGGYNSIYYNDKIYLGAGITTADVSLSRDNLDMLVDVGTGGDQIRIKDWYANNSNRVEELHFDDGTVWDVNTLHQNGAVLNGTEGDDTLSGVAGLTETINGLGGNDVIDGGTGADSIDGGAGDDTLSSDFTNSNGSTYTGGTGNDTITGGLYIDNYHFNLGDGQDTISEVGGYNSIYYNDKIYLGSGITTADVSLSRDNLDMLVDIGTGGDQIRIKDWYASNNNRIEELHFDDGTVWDVNTLHQSGAVLNGTEGADTLSGVDGLNETIHGLGGDDTINSLSGNDSVFGGDGNDVIAGGTGANTLDGGAGDDTLSSDFTNSNGSTYTGGTGNDTITGGLYIDNYHFNLGDGQDTISEVGGYNSIYYNDKIYLGSGIATTDVSVNRENQDILISVGTSGDQIRIKDWYASNNNRVEELHFDDGTIWDVNTLHNKGLELYGTSADDVITGYDNKINVIQGLDGNDTLTGGNSNDFIDGGIGTNIVEGGAGDDVLSSDFNASDGSSYRGGTGNDSVTGGNLEDTYNFNLGDGQDTVSDIGGAITSNDKLIFENMDKESLWFSQSGSDLVIDYVGTDDQVTVKDWYTNSDNHIEEIQTSDAVLHSNTVDQLVNAMAAFNVPTGVGAVIPPEEEAQLQPIIASSWQVS